MLINDGIAGEEFASLFMGTIVALKPPAGVDKEKIVLQPPNVSRDFCAYLDELCSCPEQSLQQYGSKDYIRSELHKRIDRNLDIAFERRRKELMAKRR
jgi:hypothetical protein